jgi:ABC-2 type transport system ATP-binding protein
MKTVPNMIPAAEPAIRIRDLEFRYRGASSPALRCSLRVERGELYGLLGPNGAGKSSLLALLCGRLVPGSGEIRIFGKDPVRDRKEVRQRIGLVPQNIALYMRLTAVENLAFFGRMHNMSGAEISTECARCLEIVGLEQYANRRVETFSGGMQRRLNLAVGILHSPDLLLLDEPTVGIDPQSRELIHERLLLLNRKGVTIVYTTHYMEEVWKLCSRTGIIDHGELLLEGETRDLPAGYGCADLESLFLKLTGRKLRDT